MSLFARSGLALALLIAAIAAAAAAPAAPKSKSVEQFYAQCHKQIVTPKGKLKDGDPKTDEAIEECVRKKLPAAKPAPQT